MSALGLSAGMRLLHSLSKTAAIWPFDAMGNTLVITEIFRLLFCAGRPASLKGAHGEAAFLNKGLAYFQSQPVPHSYKATGPDADLSDAMISAAALRALSQSAGMWQTGQGADKEGWIFGVSVPDN